MKPKKKRIAVVPLEEVLRRAKEVSQPSGNGVAVRDPQKSEPYVVSVAEPPKGGRL